MTPESARIRQILRDQNPWEFDPSERPEWQEIVECLDALDARLETAERGRDRAVTARERGRSGRLAAATAIRTYVAAWDGERDCEDCDDFLCDKHAQMMHDSLKDARVFLASVEGAGDEQT